MVGNFGRSDRLTGYGSFRNARGRDFNDARIGFGSLNGGTHHEVNRFDLVGRLGDADIQDSIILGSRSNSILNLETDNRTIVEVIELGRNSVVGSVEFGTSLAVNLIAGKLYRVQISVEGGDIPYNLFGYLNPVILQSNFAENS
jgi:hypothetical protein